MRQSHLPCLILACLSLLSLPAAAAAAGSCAAQEIETLQPLAADAVQAVFRERIEAFQPLAEEALAEREKLIRGAIVLRDKRERGEPLSGANLENIRLATLAHIKLRERLLQIAEHNECWLEPLAPALRTRAEFQRARNEGVMMALAAALLLYDNYLLAVSLYEQDGALRRIVDQADPGWGLSPGQMREAQRGYHSEAKRQRVRRAIEHYQREIRPQRDSLPSSEERYLAGLVEQSPSFVRIQESSVAGRVLNRIGLFNQLTGDQVRRLGKDGMGMFSMLFGNAIGVIETRQGYLHENQSARTQLLSQLKAGDILLEKTPFRLTDALIPGYWGHVAIWVGNEAELRELGVWDHPVLRPHQASIRNGRSVIEALRPGVTASTLAHFMNVDDLLALRDPAASREAQVQRVLRAFRQIGKPYDFNFDVESTDRIVCSELVYQVFTEMSWPTSRAMGRATISPDQVAERALDGQGLQVVALYQAGKPIEQDPARQLHRLMRGREPAKVALR